PRSKIRDAGGTEQRRLPTAAQDSHPAPQCKSNLQRLVVALLATVLATPIPFMMTLAGKPWAATAPLVLLAFLVTLATKNLPTPKRQIPESSETPTSRTP